MDAAVNTCSDGDSPFRELRGEARLILETTQIEDEGIVLDAPDDRDRQAPERECDLLQLTPGAAAGEWLDGEPCAREVSGG